MSFWNQGRARQNDWHIRARMMFSRAGMPWATYSAVWNGFSETSIGGASSQSTISIKKASKQDKAHYAWASVDIP